MLDHVSEEQETLNAECEALAIAINDFVARDNPCAGVLLNVCINIAAGCVCDLADIEDEQGFDSIKQQALEHLSHVIDNYRQDDLIDPLQLRIDGRRVR